MVRPGERPGRTAGRGHVNEAAAVDWSVLQRLGEDMDDPDIVGEVVAVYLGELAPRTAALAAAAGSGEAAALRAAAHALKASSATVGALGLSRLCREAEVAAAQGDAAAAADLALAAVAEASRVEPALRAGPPR